MSRWAPTALAVLLVGSPALAKAPVLAPLFPAGAARGQTLALTASGTFDHWPVRGWADGRGVDVAAGKEKGQLTIAVAPDAEPGVHWVRLADEEGATNLRPFVVGTLPEVVEAEPNDDPRKPHRLVGSSTINGRLAKQGDVDGFSLALRKGQTLVADLEANRHLASPMDAVLQVVSPAGFVLAQNDDAVGRDPRIVFDPPADGTYIVRVFAFPATPDSTIGFAGGDAYIYRLTLTTGGFLDHTFPLAVASASAGRVKAIGSSVPEAARFLDVPAGLDESRVSHPLLAGTADVRRLPIASVESEPNDPADPQAVAAPAPVAISGRIDPPGDRDVFRLGLKKGIKYALRVESRVLGLPLDPVLRLADPAGKVVAEADDTGGKPDPEIAFTPPADGEYVVSIGDLNGRGGPRFAYLLTVLVPDPDFDLTLAVDRFDLTPGKPSSVAVTVRRKDGFSGSIEVVAEGLPPGVSADPVTSRNADASARSVTLRLSGDCSAWPGPFRVVGRPSEGPRRSRTALAPNPGFDAKTGYPWLTIRPEVVADTGSK